MLVLQHALIRIIIRLGKVFFVFQRILNGTYSNLLQHLGWYLSLHQRYTAGKKWKFQDRTNHLYISGSNNYFTTAQLGTILL